MSGARDEAGAPRPWSARDGLVVLAAVAVLEALGAATGILFSANADGWYAGLAKSAFTVAVTMRAFARLDRLAAWLLAPYLAWLCFAAYLSAVIVARN